MAVVYLTPEVDTYIYNQQPDKNFSREPLLYVGFSRPDNIYRSLVKFNLINIPQPAFINKGVLRLFLCSDDFNFTKCIDIHRIVSPYEGKTVTYNTQPEYLLRSDASVVLHQEKPQFIEWNITELVKGWHSGAIINNGILLKSRSEKKPSLVSFAAQNCGYTPNVPFLLVDFCNKDLVNVSYVYTATPLPAYTDIFNTFNYKMVTFFVINQGFHGVSASVEVSPDHIHWYEEKNSQITEPGETIALVPQIFGRYTRLKFFTTGGSSKIQVYIQGQG